MSVFRHVFLRWCDVCHFFPAVLRCGQFPNVPSLLYLKPLQNSNTLLHVIYKSKKKTNLLCILNNVFQYRKIRTRKRNAKKSIKTEKHLESSPFWNPESTELESAIQYSESGIHRVESRVQECHGFPYMGREVCPDIIRFDCNYFNIIGTLMIILSKLCDSLYFFISWSSFSMRYSFSNKNRRKAIFNWAAKGLFFLKGGDGYTHSGYHKTLSVTIVCDGTSCETDPFERLS